MPPRRKRKAIPKYDDDEEDEAPVKPVKRAKSTAEKPTKRSTAPRAVKVKRDDPEWLVTNEHSSLAYEDLHAELSDPRTYENYTKEDWDDLRSTLPENTPLNPDGYSIHIDFLKYDPDFRRGIREFQEDLAAGRLDPKWQAEAAQAMEERARGDFDAYKENQYEEFWGQKQKLPYTALAGESRAVRLEVMIENGMFRVGDEISFSRVIGRKEKRMLFEKECKIASIGHQALTIAIPAGQLKYARPSTASAVALENNSPGKSSEVNGDVSELSPQDTGEQSEARDINHEKDADSGEAATLLGNFDSGWHASEASIATKRGHGCEPTQKIEDSSNECTSSSHSHDALILHQIDNLKQLMDKMIELDGRLDPKDQKQVPAISPWKCMRLKRDNQDLGTLFEMREDFYTYKLPHLVGSRKK